MPPSSSSPAPSTAAEFNALTRIQEGHCKMLYENTAQDSVPAYSDKMCWVSEWMSEWYMPERKEGDTVDVLFQRLTKHGMPTHLDDKPPPPPKEDVLVFSDNYGICKALLAKAPAGRIGKKNIVTDLPGKITEEDIARLLSTKWDLVIFGCGMDMPASNHPEDVIDFQYDLTRLYLFLLQGILRNKSGCKRLAVLTRGVFTTDHEIHEEIGISLTGSASLLGMGNSARQELEDVPIQYIDTDYELQDEIVESLASECFCTSSFGHSSVRLLNDSGGRCNGETRYVQRQMPSSYYEQAGWQWELPEDGIIAISGGNGALALVFGNWILDKAEKMKPKPTFQIKFLSRSMKISDANMKHWKELQKAAKKLNIHIEQARCDISTQEAVDEFVESCEGKLTGYMHAAGFLQDSMLQNQTWEKYEAVFGPKSSAALYFHDALERIENPDLKFMWLFSSVAVNGNMGQTNYSGSNAILDAIARHRYALGKPCTAIQWGAWGDVGMATTMDFASRQRTMNGPMPYFSNDEGFAGLDAGLRAGLCNFSVLKFNPPVMLGMVTMQESRSQCYMGNFSALIWPHPPPKDFSRKHAYRVFQEFRRMVCPHKEDSEWLYFNQYTNPILMYDRLDSWA